MVGSAWYDNPNLIKCWYPMRHAKQHIHPIIRELLDDGYYVCFGDIDDYYVEGKSWYRERHHNHDGLICGYSQEDKTYCMYAYDSSWVYRKFWTSQKGFEEGRKSMFKQGAYGTICGMKPSLEQISFCPEKAMINIAEYLYPSGQRNPASETGDVLGIAVHKYIAKYIDRLYEGVIPYERMDQRIFRLIWEHKKLMHERIIAMEQYFTMGTQFGENYKQIVKDADSIRILYAAHGLRRRDSLLPAVKDKLLKIENSERDILSRLLDAMKGEMQI